MTVDARSDGRKPRPSAGRVLRIAVSILVPPAVALAAIHTHPIGGAAVERPGLLALGVLTIALSMLFRRMRSYLVIALAYSAALLALRAGLTRHTTDLPESVAWLMAFYPIAWVLLFGLAAFAGTLEAIRPGTQLAKRILFAAAAIFLGGHGAVGLLTEPNALSLAAVLGGALSLATALISHRLTLPIVARPHADVPTAADLAAERRRRLQHREWHDTGAAR